MHVQKLPDILSSTSCGSSIAVVSVRWLEDCLKRGTLLDVTDYQLNHEKHE